MEDLNKNLLPQDAPIANRSFTPAFVFDTTYEIQGARINSSKVNLKQLIKRTVGGTVVGSFATGSVITLSSVINYNPPKIANRSFGKAVVGIYQGAGTLSANQIYPITGGSVTVGRYVVQGGDMDINHYNGTYDEWRAQIVDTTGTSSQQLTFSADWTFVDYVTGAID